MAKAKKYYTFEKVKYMISIYLYFFYILYSLKWLELARVYVVATTDRSSTELLQVDLVFPSAGDPQLSHADPPPAVLELPILCVIPKGKFTQKIYSDTQGPRTRGGLGGSAPP